MESNASHVAWTKTDTKWVLSLYGTAIGAGVLFLPINVGMGGLLPLLIMLVLAYPMTFLAHRSLSFFVISDERKDGDITMVAGKYFGKKGSFAMSVLYFLSIFPVQLIYSVGITNSVETFAINHLGVDAETMAHYRLLLAFVLVGILVAIVYYGENVIVTTMSYLVYPFVISLVLISLFLIPEWKTDLFTQSEFVINFDFWKHIWLILPVMIFAFNHTAIISSLAVSRKKSCSSTEEAEYKCSKIISRSVMLMVVTVMFFVFSCALSLSPQDFALAKQQNIPVLSYVSNKFDAPVLAYIAPIIAYVAMSKSFLGHHLGAKEGFGGIICMATNKYMDPDALNKIFAIATFIVAWLVAYYNPSILSIIESIGGLIIATILFIVPIYSIWRFDSLKAHRNKLISVFILGLGFMALFSSIYDLIY